MNIKRDINIADDKLLNGLQAVLGLIDQINKSKDTSDKIDFKNASFVTPIEVSLMNFITYSLIPE